MNAIVRAVTWNIHHDVREIIARAFELEPGHTITTDGRNKRFELLDETIPDGTEDDGNQATHSIRHRVSIMFP